MFVPNNDDNFHCKADEFSLKNCSDFVVFVSPPAKDNCISVEITLDFIIQKMKQEFF